MIISMIAAVASCAEKKDKYVIGKDNQMLWHLPADFAWFKQQTLGKPIVMGRKTYESIGRPLPGRLNIVITRDPELKIEGCTCVTSLEQALQTAQTEGAEELMVIGGGAIYEAFLPLAERLYLTFVETELKGDTYFPNWQQAQVTWQETSSQSYFADEKNPYNMRFTILEKQAS